MIITQLQELEKSKVRVTLDHENTLVLLQKDIENYKLREGACVPPALYEEIIEDVLYPRAIQKALSVLKFSDRTGRELREKLSGEGYSDQIIDRVIAYLLSYDYLNEERLAGSYIRARMNRKSRLMIKNELLQKGIDKNTLDKALQEAYGTEDAQRQDPEEDPELTAIRKAIAKKTSAPESLTYEEKQRLIASLYRKGFDIGKIKHFL